VSNQKTAKVAIPLPPVELSESDYARLREQTGKTDVAPILATWIKFFVQQQMNGAILIPGNEVADVEKKCGVRIARSKDLCGLAMKSKGIEDGQYVLKARLDPVYIQPLEEFAKANGVPPEFVLEDICNQTVENGWLFEWHRAENKRVNFTARAWKKVCKALGMEKPMGEDIANHLEPEGEE
jgi:hypothetical protein